MTWDSERSKSGKKPWNWIEIAVDRCTHTWGDGAGSPSSGGCPAVLGVDADDKCHNSWETCPVRDSFRPSDYWVRFCEPTSDIPRTFEFSNVSPPDDGLPVFLPFLKSFKHDPSIPDPGESLGVRARFTAMLQDAPHHDFGIDKYASERVTGAASTGSPSGTAFDPMSRSTMLRKLKARFPYYVGRKLRWYQGYITASPSLADFRMREYIMEGLEGPDANGRARIIANDVLRMLDDDRAKAPAKSRGQLVSAIATGDAVTSIAIETTDATEYDLKSGETEDYIRIGDEIFTYTGTSPIGSPATGVTLTGVTREAPAPYTTAAGDHDEGDLVQRCRYFSGTVTEVVEELMVDYAGVPSRYIPSADWQSETEVYAPETIERLITEPEGVRSIVDDITQQTMTWAFWFDEVDQEIKYRAFRPADIDEAVPALNDDEHIVAGSVQVKDMPDKIINEIQVLFGQIDPTLNRDEVNNYRRGLLDVNSDSQSTSELGQRRIKRIFALWHPSSNANVVDQFARRTVNTRSKNLIEVSFSLERKDEDVRTSQFCDLTTLYIVGVLGLPREIRVQVLQANSTDEQVTLKAREDFFREQYARIAPGGGSPGDPDGLLWDNASEAQRARYVFLANEDGYFTNGDRGKALA